MRDGIHDSRHTQSIKLKKVKKVSKIGYNTKKSNMHTLFFFNEN